MFPTYSPITYKRMGSRYRLQRTYLMADFKILDHRSSVNHVEWRASSGQQKWAMI